MQRRGETQRRTRRSNRSRTRLACRRASSSLFPAAQKCVKNCARVAREKILKLALIGTHGVGKTTLAYEICSLLKKADHNVELVTEVARQSPFPVNAATTLEGQLWILHAQIAAELDAARRAPHVICDRSVLDNYCYLVNKFGRQPQLESWLAWWMDSYDLLVGVPLLTGAIVADGFRSEDLEFQGRVDELLRELLRDARFSGLSHRVLWLEGRERRVWGERIFACAAPLVGAARAQSATAR
jgi:nicotinamide riboside kinase